MSLYPNHAVDKEARFFARFESVHNLPPPHVAHAHGGVENAWEAPKPEVRKESYGYSDDIYLGCLLLEKTAIQFPNLGILESNPRDVASVLYP